MKRHAEKLPLEILYQKFQRLFSFKRLGVLSVDAKIGTSVYKKIAEVAEKMI